MTVKLGLLHTLFIIEVTKPVASFLTTLTTNINNMNPALNNK